MMLQFIIGAGMAVQIPLAAAMSIRLQKVPAAHSEDPYRQAPPAATPKAVTQVPAAEQVRGNWQALSLVQVAPAATLGAQSPVLQYEVTAQNSSLPQEVPSAFTTQAPLVQVPVIHSALDVQGSFAYLDAVGTQA